MKILQPRGGRINVDFWIKRKNQAKYRLMILQDMILILTIILFILQNENKQSTVYARMATRERDNSKTSNTFFMDKKTRINNAFKNMNVKQSINEVWGNIRNSVNLQKTFSYRIDSKSQLYTEIDFNNYDMGFKSFGIRKLLYRTRFNKEKVNNIINSFYIDTNVKRLPYVYSKYNFFNGKGRLNSIIQYLKQRDEKRTTLRIEHHLRPRIQSMKPFNKLMVSI